MGGGELGAIAIVYGAFVCVAQSDLKRLIAYSSVSHMGYVMLGIGAAAYAFGYVDGQPMLGDEAVMNSAAAGIRRPSQRWSLRPNAPTRRLR